MLVSFILLVVLLIVIQGYFNLALRYDIIDNPNNRSSHLSPTIRGGGVVIPIAVLLYYFISGFQSSFFIAGLVLISTVSLIDDIRTLGNIPRLIVHMIAVGLLLYQLDVFTYQWGLILAAFILVIGTINAVNFMDGINGMTAGYSIIVVLSLMYINSFAAPFIESAIFQFVLPGLFVFAFYNFRSKARCFAGDVGSVSVAFILCYFVLTLVITTKNISFILFLAVYGIDTVVTIVQRLFAKENIFKAHRLHLFQYLVNECKFSHLVVASSYAVLQGFINAVVMHNFQYQYSVAWKLLVGMLVVLGVVYITVKWNIHSKYYA